MKVFFYGAAVVIGGIMIANAIGALASEWTTETTVLLCILAFFLTISYFAGRSVERSYMAPYRLSQFADANHWGYIQHIPNPTHHGVIFGQGYSRLSSNILYLEGSSEYASFEIGDYAYTVGSGKNRRRYLWSYACIEMDRNLPNMLLDSKDNNVQIFGRTLASNLPVTMKGNQVLSLEGDFDTHFTLYAPKEYERDALYVFTPDVMALLIDSMKGVDAEVIDNKFYIYMPRYTNTQTLDPKFLEKVFAIMNTVGMKLHRQTDYYADETVNNRAEDVVAAGGRRLKRGTAWGYVIAIIVIIVGMNVVPLFLGK
jgi:hypothetical protein